jgi:Flp pilus assembly protein TadD
MSRLTCSFLLVPVLLAGCHGSNDSSVVQTAKPASKAGNPDTRLSIARVREQEGKLSSAAAILQELCQSDPKNAEYAHRYGIVQSKLGDFENGLKWLGIADSLKPDDPEILNDLGFACLMTGRAQQASLVLETALELDPQNSRAVNNLALAHGYQGEFDKAHDLFLTNMTEAQAMSNLGYVATQTGKKEFAIQCYSRAIDLDPDLQEAKEGLLQLAELEQRINERKDIASASRQPSGVINASADQPKGTPVILQTSGESTK